MLPTMPFGQTGHLSTRTIFGAAALGSRTQEEADTTLEFLLEKGVNHIDTAADYGDSELRLGPSMARYRDRFFLATKTAGRTYDDAKTTFMRSLERMQTDHVDLLQMHLLVDENDWSTAFGPGGAFEYLLEARDQGLTRFLGVTGHGLSVATMHQRSLDKHRFDAVLLPWNYPMASNAQYADDFKRLHERCLSDGVAMQTIKGICKGPWGDKEHTRTVWYEPLEEQDDIDRAVFWVLSQPQLFLNTAGDIDLLPRIIDAAERFGGAGPAPTEMEEMVRSVGMAPLFAQE